MHTLSTRTLSALAFDRGEEYDPAMAVAPDLIETLSLIEQARPMIGEDGPYERQRQAARERRQRKAIPEWFSATTGRRERARDQVRRVNPNRRPARDAGQAVDGGALLVACRER